MQIEYGINPNCSETVFRIPKMYVNCIPEEVIAKDSIEYHLYRTDGYSQMLPTEDTVCLYFYQSWNYSLMQWLEENKIPYDIQAPFYGGEDPNLKPIEPTEKEKQMLRDGGNGEFYRRKPYGN